MSMKVLIAMSGGVDSSVAACLLKEEGYEAAGAILRLTRPFSAAGQAAQDRDVDDARRVAASFGLPFFVFEEQEAFDRLVIRDFIDSYEAGCTPNPCVVCNKTVKFGRFLDRALKEGFDKVATGHYVRLRFDEESGRYQLLRAKDARKDQSYMLHGLSQEQLSRCLFPLGDLSKDEVRAIAAKYELGTAGKHDSQDICFVPDGDYAAFMERHEHKTYPGGDFVDAEGRVIGSHKGYVHYTVGQRKGLGIASSAPLFVTKIRPAENQVVLSHGEGLFSRTVWADRVNFVGLPSLDVPMRCSVKLRYSHKAQPALVSFEDGRLKAVFEEPQRAVTPGQSMVAYQDDLLIAGGIICGSEA